MTPIQVKVRTKYTSICANRHENGIKCLTKYLLFSRANCPILYDLDINECVLTLLGHSQQVNGQNFVSQSSDSDDDRVARSCKIISTSYDNTARIWLANFATKTFELLHILLSPDGSVFNTRLAIQHNDNIVSITTTIKGTVCQWFNGELIDQFSLKFVPTASQIHNIEFQQQSYWFVFVSGTDNLIHVYQLNCDTSKITPILDIKGHEDWIKSIEIINLGNERPNEFLVASASQDWYIRVWHMKISDMTEATDNVRLQNEHSIYSEKCLLYTLETVLHHGNIVSSVAWFKDLPNLKLASCSIDKTVIIWSSIIAKPIDIDQSGSATDGLWKESYRFGETSEINLPFLGICISPLDPAVLFVQSLKGAIHSWELLEGSDQIKPRHCITGHSEAVTDIAWEKEGRYLLTCSLDKTTRLHGKFLKRDIWHELARPQVHGHEINCVASIKFGKMAVGAEEKTIRNYGATEFFLKSFEALTGHKMVQIMDNNTEDQYPKHAQLPALGLSIRGAESPFDTQVTTKGDNEMSKLVGGQSNVWCGISKLADDMSKIDHLDDLPTEEILIQSTLWWETNKLYGHGNEIHALDINNDGSFMASASKANRAELAFILIWDCNHHFRKVASINHHSLTITRLRFSPDGKYLLSVSRDRTWCLSIRTGNARQPYRKLIGSNKTNGIHERIIWDCCWTEDSEYFMTVSRDKKAILWCMQEVKSNAQKEDQEVSVIFNQVSVRKFEDSIQAVDCINQGNSQSYIFAFGLDDASLELYQVAPQSKDWSMIAVFKQYHQMNIRRIAILNSKPSTLMATGSEDGLVKVVELIFE